MLPKIENYPVWVKAILLIFRGWLFLYDLLAYIPFQIFASPKQKLERSKRIKAKPLKDGNPASPWRNVDHFNELAEQMFEGTSTLDQIWDRSTMFYGNAPCMGTREVLGVEQEKQPSGRMFEKLVLGEYHWQTFSEIQDRVLHVGSGLLSIGHKPKHNIVIFADTSAEWMITALACFKYNFPVCTVYATLGEEAIAHAINETEAETIITTRELVPKILKLLPHCREVQRLVYIRAQLPNTEPPTLNFDTLPRGFKVHSFEELEELGNEKSLDPEVYPKSSDLAVIMYTSGTTGLPKGVMLSHANVIAATTGLSAAIPEFGYGDVYVGYLPLAHVLELSAEFSCLSHGVCIGYSTPLTLTDQSSKVKRGCKGDLSLIQPTVMAAVPTVVDRIYKNVVDKVNNSSPLRQALFHCMYERKRNKIEEGYDNPFLNRLIFSHIRAILGGRVRLMVSGGAPLSSETQRFMNICFCCPVGQGYGLTETCGGGAISDAEDLETSRVGAPIICNDIMLRDWPEAGYLATNKPRPQGELLISGANVALGYLKNAEKTAEDFIELNGRRWMCTGDIGEFCDDGSLRIIDRKKDLVKLQHGEYVSLAKVETALLTCPIVDNICVHGNSLHPSLVALIVPNRKLINELGEKLNLSVTNFEKLCQDSRVINGVKEEIDRYAKCRNLSKLEMPSKIYLCTEVWTADMGLLTEALKLKRRPIEKHYEKVLQKMYSNDTAEQ